AGIFRQGGHRYQEAAGNVSRCADAVHARVSTTATSRREYRSLSERRVRPLTSLRTGQKRDAGTEASGPGRKAQRLMVRGRPGRPLESPLRDFLETAPRPPARRLECARPHRDLSPPSQTQRPRRNIALHSGEKSGHPKFPEKRNTASHRCRPYRTALSCSRSNPAESLPIRDPETEEAERAMAELCCPKSPPLPCLTPTNLSPQSVSLLVCRWEHSLDPAIRSETQGHHQST